MYATACLDARGSLSLSLSLSLYTYIYIYAHSLARCERHARTSEASRLAGLARLTPPTDCLQGGRQRGYWHQCVFPPSETRTDVLPSVRVLASVWLYSKCPCLYSKVTLLTSASSRKYLCARYGREAEAATRGVTVKAEARHARQAV
jgi:hypothetical protein